MAPIHRKGHEDNNNRHSSDLSSYRNTSRKPPTDIIWNHIVTKRTEKKHGKSHRKKRRIRDVRETGRSPPHWKGESTKEESRKSKNENTVIKQEDDMEVNKIMKDISR